MLSRCLLTSSFVLLPLNLLFHLPILALHRSEEQKSQSRTRRLPERVHYARGSEAEGVPRDRLNRSRGEAEAGGRGDESTVQDDRTIVVSG